MTMVANAKMWYRRLGCLNKRSLPSSTGRIAMGSHATVLFRTTLSVRWRKTISWLIPEKTNHAAIKAHIHLLYGDLMGPFKPTAHGGYILLARLLIIPTSGPQSTLQLDRSLRSRQERSNPLASFQLFVTLKVIPLGKYIIRWRTDKGSKFTDSGFKDYRPRTGIT